MAGSGSPVTEERRRVLLWILWVHGPGTPASITALAKSHHKQKGERYWPQADWPNAVREPYEGGVRQLLDQLVKDGRARNARIGAQRAYDWNPEVLTPRQHALEVLNLRRQGFNNQQIATRLRPLNPKSVATLYHDPFGLRERERKSRYCAGCGQAKQEDQTVCPGCVRRRRLELADNAEALLPDSSWAHALAVVCPVDFAVTDDLERRLIVHTERGDVELDLLRGETWQAAVDRAGVLRA